MSNPFVHLGARSHYSIGASMARVEELCWEAARDRQGSLALCDRDSLAGAWEFAAAAAHAGLKPLFGAELSVLPRGATCYRGQVHVLRLLVWEARGWRRLVELISLARAQETEDVPPHVAFSAVAERLGGLIVCAGGPEGELTARLRAGEFEAAEALIDDLTAAAGPGNVFIELTPPTDAAASKEAHLLRSAARHFGLRTIAIPRVSCAHGPDDIVRRFFSGEKGSDGRPPRRVRDLLREPAQRESLNPRETVARLYREYPEALESTITVAEQCAAFSIPTAARRFPIHDFQRGVDAESFIWNAAFDRARERYGEIPARYKERLDREFRLLVDAELPNAIVSLCRLDDEFESRGIQRGPGAGLFTNSLVASLLGLTRFDPMRFDLPFDLPAGLAEGEFPMLELSIPTHQHGEAVGALSGLLGGNICAVGRWEPWKAAAIHERVGDLLGRGAKWMTTITRDAAYQRARKQVAEHPVTWSPPPEAAFEGPEVLAWLVARLEGRHRQLAAEGMLYAFSADPVAATIPTQRVRLGGASLPVAQWPSATLGAMRLGRIRFSSAPLLDLIDRGCALVREQGDESFLPENVRGNDGPTYRLLREGRTAGIPPLEAPDVRRKLRQGQPADLHSLVSLLRARGREPGLDFSSLLLSHLCAALKAHKPMEFLAAAASEACRDRRRLGIVFEEIRARGILMHAPDINLSRWSWSIEADGLRAGLMNVREMTQTAAEEIVRKRQEMLYGSLEDFCRRVDASRVKPRQMHALVRAGAFDALGESREHLRRLLERAFPAEKAALNPYGDFAGQFFDRDEEWWREHAGTAVPEAAQDTGESLLRQEIDAIVLPIRQTPTRQQLEFPRRADIHAAEELALKRTGSVVSLLGVAGPVQGDPVHGDSVLMDLAGALVRARGGLGAELAGPELAGRLIVVTGTIQREPFQWRLEAESIRPFEEACAAAQATQRLVLDLSKIESACQKELLAALRRFPGPTTISMEWLPAKSSWTLRRIARQRVLLCPRLEHALNRLAGPEAWRVAEEPAAKAAARPGLLRRLLPRFG